LVQLWRRARRRHELPDPRRLEAARRAVDYRAIKLDLERKTARLTRPNMRLDLGGIGVGYAVDEALAVLKRHGIRSAMIDASGDIGALDAPPGKSGWRIGIAPHSKSREPTRLVSLVNAALAVSGDAQQYIEIDGIRYSHIVDPRTGLGLTDQSTVTVIAKDCTTADSFATAVSVLGAKKGLALVALTAGAEAAIDWTDGGKPQHVESEGFRRYEAAGETPE
jgi:thiamine biosynthesis lipoprotein